MTEISDDTFEQRPLLLIFRKRETERKFLNYHYGKDRNWTIFFIYCIGAIAITQFALTIDKDYVEWWTTDVLTGIFTGCFGLLFCCSCTIRHKFFLEFSFVFSYLVIAIRYNIKGLMMEGLNYYPLKIGVVVFEICFYFVIRPRFFVYLPLSAILCLVFTIFVLIYFIPRSNDHRYIAAIISYYLNQWMIIVFLYFNDQTSRQNFVNSEIVKSKKKKYEEEHSNSVQLLKNILPETFIDSIFDGTLHREGVLIDEIESGSCLLSDIMSFTPLCSQLSSELIVFFLDRHFSVNDEIIKSITGCEKVKTIGDACLVISLKDTKQHELKMVLLGLAIIESLELLNEKHKWKENERFHTISQGVETRGISIRVGVSSGKYYPIVFGGGRSVSFDVFGKPIQECYRLEPTGIPGYVHVSKNVFRKTFSHFHYLQTENEDQNFDDEESIRLSEMTEQNQNKNSDNLVISENDDEILPTQQEEMISIIEESNHTNNEEDEKDETDIDRTFFVPYKKRLGSILDSSLREKLFKVVKYAISSKSYIKKREDLITRCDNDTSSSSQNDDEKSHKRFDIVIDNNNVCDDKENIIIEQELLEDDHVSGEDEFSVSSDRDEASSGIDKSNGLSQVQIIDEELLTEKVNTIDLFSESIHNNIELDGVRRYNSQKDKNYVTIFLCCFVITTFRFLKSLIFSYLCSPCISLVFTSVKFICGCLECCIFPISKYGWVYALSVFCPLNREKEYIEDFIMRSEKLTFLLIFLFNFSHKFVIVVYFLTTKRYEVMYNSVLIYIFYAAFFLEIFSMAYIVITMIPIYIRVTKKKKFKVDNPIYQNYSILLQKQIPGITSTRDHQKKKKIKKKVKVKQYFKHRVKLFDYLLYRPIAVYILTILNLLMGPICLMFLILFDGGNTIPLKVLTTGEDNSEPIFLDIFYLMFLYGLVYIALVPFFHICFRLFLFVALTCIQIFHAIYNFNDVPEIVHDRSRVRFLISEFQYTALIIAFFTFYTFVNDVSKRNAYNKKKRVFADTVKIVEKKSKNDMIIRSVLPKEVIIYHQKMKKNLKRKRFDSFVIGASTIDDVCFCFIKVMNISKALLLPFEELDEEKMFETTSDPEKEICREISKKRSVKRVVNFLVDLFKEFDEVLEVVGCRKIKSIQDVFLFITLPHSSFSQKEKLSNYSYYSGESNQYIKNIITASELCLKKLNYLRHKYGFNNNNMNMKGVLGEEEISSNCQSDCDEISLRIGLHVGSACTGVVGNSKFLFDVYGDSVNITSRLSTTSENNKIHLLKETTEKYQKCFDDVFLNRTNVSIRHRGKTYLKGKGEIETSFLEFQNILIDHPERKREEEEETQFMDKHYMSNSDENSFNTNSIEYTWEKDQFEVNLPSSFGTEEEYERERNAVLEKQAIQRIIETTNNLIPSSSKTGGKNGKEVGEFGRKKKKRRQDHRGDVKFVKMKYGKRMITI